MTKDNLDYTLIYQTRFIKTDRTLGRIVHNDPDVLSFKTEAEAKEEAEKLKAVYPTIEVWGRPLRTVKKEQVTSRLKRPSKAIKFHP